MFGMATNTKNSLPTSTQNQSKKKKTTRMVVVIVIVVVAVALLVGTFAILWQNGILGNKEEYQKLVQDRKVVATCNGFEIPYEELRFVTTLYKNSLAHAYGEDIWDNPETAEQYRAELEDLVMENLNENYLILSTCEYLSIDTESKVMKDYVDTQMKDMLANDFGGDKSKMIEDFEKDGLTERYMRFLIGVEYLQSTIYYTLLDAGLYDYSTSNIGEFIDYVMAGEDYARTIHVFVGNDEGDDIEANRAKAQNVVDKVGAVVTYQDRIEMMHKFIGSAVNEDTQLVSGNGYYFTYGEMDEAYEKATFELTSTQISDVVETEDGFYVIMRLDPELDYVTKNAATLLKYYQSASMGAYIDGFEDQCQVVFNDYGKSLDLVNLE